MPTVDELREEIRDLADVPEFATGTSGLRTGELDRIARELGIDHPPGSSPMLRGAIRRELGKRAGVDAAGIDDAAPFRKDDLVQVRDALEEADDAG